jgi:hypothetical protein
MLDRFIMGAGAIGCAAGLGFASFAIGLRIARSAGPAQSAGVMTGLVLSTALAAWGIVALLIWRRPGRP